MTIHWQLIPLIVFAILYTLYWISKRNDADAQLIWGVLAGALLPLVSLFYLCLGVIWIAKHVNII